MRGDEPEVAAKLRIEERDLGAGGPNWIRCCRLPVRALSRLKGALRPRISLEHPGFQRREHEHTFRATLELDQHPLLRCPWTGNDPEQARVPSSLVPTRWETASAPGDLCVLARRWECVGGTRKPPGPGAGGSEQQHDREPAQLPLRGERDVLEVLACGDADDGGTGTAERERGAARTLRALHPREHDCADDSDGECNSRIAETPPTPCSPSFIKERPEEIAKVSVASGVDGVLSRLIH